MGVDTLSDTHYTECMDSSSSTITAKITAIPSANLDAEYAAGSIDAVIYRGGQETDMEVTLVTSHLGEYDTWGSEPDHWCSRTDLLSDWGQESSVGICGVARDIVSAVRDAAEAQ